MLRLLLAIAAGGALGSVARYGVALAALRGGATFPFGTLVVNVLGSFALGAIARAAVQDPAATPGALQLGLTVGFCGGFTTFSTFSLDTLRLLQAGEHGRAASYALVSVLLSVGAVWAGWTVMHVGRRGW